MAVAMGAVRRMKVLPLAIADLSHGMARYTLKQLSAARRAARPPSPARDARTVEYLYEVCIDPYWYNWLDHSLSRYRIIKKTKVRIYFSEDDRFPSSDPDFQNTYFIDRTALERGESIWHRRIRHSLSLSPPQPEEAKPLPDLRQLKAEMAAAHPDRGGSDAAFIAARKQYLSARKLMESDDLG